MPARRNQRQGIASDPVIKAFVEALQASFGSHLKRIILFGSRARGDSSEESDYDFLLIFNTLGKNMEAKVQELAEEFFSQREALITALCFSEEEFYRRRFEPFIINAKREGVIFVPEGDDKDVAQQLEAMRDKAGHCLRSAGYLLERGDYDSACSRAYYAVFHLVSAALLTKGLAFSKHSGVINGFSRHFVKAGTFPEEFRRIINRLRRDREVADYEYFSHKTRQEAEQNLIDAKRLAEAMEQYLEAFTRRSSSD